MAQVLSFVLKFDDLKMNNPSVQNDFSYYRRTLSRMKMKDPGSDDRAVVNNEQANRMSLFYAYVALSRVCVCVCVCVCVWFGWGMTWRVRMLLFSLPFPLKICMVQCGAASKLVLQLPNATPSMRERDDHKVCGRERCHRSREHNGLLGRCWSQPNPFPVLHKYHPI
jgi:hypothetical protein